jgi:hypothetical protein
VIYGEPLAYIEVINRDPRVPKSLKLFMNITFALFIILILCSILVLLFQSFKIFE